MLQDLDKRQRPVGSVDAAVARPIPVSPAGRVNHIWWISGAIMLLLVVLFFFFKPAPESEFPLQPPSRPMEPAPMPQEGVAFEPENMPEPVVADQNSEPLTEQQKLPPIPIDESSLVVTEDDLAKPLGKQKRAVQPQAEPKVAPKPKPAPVVAKPAPVKPVAPKPKRSSGQVKRPSGENPKRTLDIAEEYLATGRLAEAESKLNRVLELDPRMHRAREMLVGLMIRSGRDDIAALLLDEGRKLAPNRPLFALLQVRLLLQQGRRIAAIDLLKDIKSPAGGGQKLLTMLAALQQQEEQHEEAVATYQKLAKLDPGNGNHWVGMGISLEALDKKAEAMRAYDRSLRGDTLTPELAIYAAERLKALQ
jgi:MSHA biogenesis protein MshN